MTDKITARRKKLCEELKQYGLNIYPIIKIQKCKRLLASLNELILGDK